MKQIYHLLITLLVFSNASIASNDSTSSVTTNITESSAFQSKQSVLDQFLIELAKLRAIDAQQAKELQDLKNRPPTGGGSSGGSSKFGQWSCSANGSGGGQCYPKGSKKNGYNYTCTCR